jgi:hypothetical protein
MSDGASLSISAARAQLAAIIDRGPAASISRSMSLGVGVAWRRSSTPTDLDRLIELAEDMADIRAAAQARAEMQQTGAAPIPWDQVKADLGLT